MARYCQALTAVGLAAGMALSAAPAEAQQTRTPDPNAPRLMVGIFRAPDTKSGVQVGDAIRDRLTRDLNVKQMWVIPKQDITATLEASGFPVDQPLAPHDARALAQQLRADMYVVGNVIRDSTGQGYRVDAQYVLARDNALVQPLPPVRVGKPSDAANAVAKSFRDAHAQFAAERDCYRAAREQKFPEARAAAQRGIAAYPQATLSRLCLANVMKEQKAPNDSILALVNQVIAIDPRSRPALTIAYEIYSGSNQAEKASETLLALLAADPTNTRLMEQVINEFARTGQAARAVPLVNRLVTENPGDPNYLNLAMRVKLAAKDYKGGIAAGEEMMRVDTSTANIANYSRLAAAAIVDSQPQKGAELMARAAAKFADSARVHVEYADILSSAGQVPQALASLNRAIQLDPKVKGAYLTKARIQAEANQPDSAFSTLQLAQQAGDSASDVARQALSIGQSLYRAKNHQGAARLLAFANRTSPSPEGQLLEGVNSLSLAQGLLQQAQSQKSCPAARAAVEAITNAQTNIGLGGKANPTAAAQALSAAQQLGPVSQQMQRAVCR